MDYESIFSSAFGVNKSQAMMALMAAETAADQFLLRDCKMDTHSRAYNIARDAFVLKWMQCELGAPEVTE